MAKITADISKDIDITARRNDSFYLSITASNDDGTVYDLLKDDGATAFDCKLYIYNSDGNAILGFSSGTETPSYFVESVITVTPGTGVIVIDVPASGITLMKGAYKYKMVVYGTTEVNTLISGKFKLIDIV
tara:strand:- start:32 stop:424 length:393 start_codon:yes stop_codon:yes gene_type:complete